MAKAPPLLPCIMNRVPGFSIFRNFFFSPPCDLIQRSIRVATFRNEKLSFLSVALCEQVYIFLYSSLTWKYFYVRPRITNYFYLDLS